MSHISSFRFVISINNKQEDLRQKLNTINNREVLLSTYNWRNWKRENHHVKTLCFYGSYLLSMKQYVWLIIYIVNLNNNVFVILYSNEVDYEYGYWFHMSHDNSYQCMLDTCKYQLLGKVNRIYHNLWML